MRIQVSIFFSLLCTFLNVIHASEDPVSVNQVEPVSIDQVEPFFSHLFYCFFNLNIKKAVSEADFCMAKKLYQNFPLETLEAVRSFESRQFSFLFSRLIHSIDFAAYKCSCNDITRQCCKIGDIDYTFDKFSDFIVEIINRMLNGSDLIKSKKSILEILSILKRVNYSSFMVVHVSWLCTKVHVTTILPTTADN